MTPARGWECTASKWPRVVAVLGHLLEAGGHLERVGRVQGVGGVVGLLDGEDLVQRDLVRVRVVPGEHDAVGLGHREAPEPGLGVGPVGVGDGHVATGAVPGPAVEGAAEAAVGQRPVPEVGPEVRAVGLVGVQRPVAVPPEHELGAEVAAGDDLARRDLVGLGDLEPAERQGERKAAHGAGVEEVLEAVAVVGAEGELLEHPDARPGRRAGPGRPAGCAGCRSAIGSRSSSCQDSPAMASSPFHMPWPQTACV